MIHQTITILEYLVLAYLTIQVAYLLFFSLAGKLVKPVVFARAKQLRRIRIFIPGYKEDAVIIATAKNAITQDYPGNLYEVVIIADSFSDATLSALRSLPIKVIEVHFENSTKGKALQKAIEATCDTPTDILLILDADNHMAPGFLHAVNNAFEKGYQVVQGHRTAKNFQTSFAFLDACIEEINNHYFRRGHAAVGLPSALIGSGMAFEWNLFTAMLKDIGETSGEDKEFEFRLLRQRKKMAFLDGAFVYDEKVASSEVFTKQRSRWLAIQVEFFKKYFAEGWLQLFRGNVAFFNKVFQTYLFPRVLLIATLFIWLLFVLLFAPQFTVISVALIAGLAISLLLGIPARWYNKQFLTALLQIPGALFSMIAAMMHMGKARKTFIHTPHGETV